MAPIILALISLVLAYILWKVYSFAVNYRRLCEICKKIPGRKPHWFLGNLDKIKNSTQYVQLVEELTKKGAKLYCIWSGPWPIIGTTHPETCKVVLKSTEPKALRLADGYRMMIPWLGDGLLLSSGPHWERNRRLLTPAFHFDILKDYTGIYNDVAELFLEILEEKRKLGGSVEIYDLVSKATLDTMLRCTLSYTENVQCTGDQVHPYVQAVRTLTNLVWKRLTSFPKFFDTVYSVTADGRLFAKLVRYAHDFTEKIIESRRKDLETGKASAKKRHLDFLDVLLTAKDENGNHLTDQEIRDEVDTFLFEGHDTTASGISFMIYSLGLHQDHQQSLYDEVKEVTGNRDQVVWDDFSKLQKMAAFMKESMRLYNPVPIIAREPKNPMVLDGLEIPVGTRIDVNLQAVHQHPDVWENPEVFDPSRFDGDKTDKDPFAFIPFSAGPRNCIGQNFAMNEMKCFLVKLIKRYRILPDDEHKTVAIPEIVTKPETGIKIYLEKRTD